MTGIVIKFLDNVSFANFSDSSNIQYILSFCEIFESIKGFYADGDTKRSCAVVGSFGVADPSMFVELGYRWDLVLLSGSHVYRSHHFRNGAGAD